MESKPKLSIIIPIYNVEKFIERCLLSISNQNDSLSFYEVILVNDGSSDNSSYIAQQFLNKNSNWKIINQNNQGLSAARNSGYNVAKGEYVWFIDSDDWIETDLLTKIPELLKENHDIISLNFCITNGSERFNLPYKRKVKPGKLYKGKDFLKTKGHYFGVPFYIYRKSFLNEKNLVFKVGIYHEDNLFSPQAIFLAKSIIYDKSIYYYYFQRSGSICNSRFTTKRGSDLLTISDDLIVFCKKYANSLSDYVVLSRIIAQNLSEFYRGWRTLDRFEKLELAKQFNSQRMYWKYLFLSLVPKYVMIPLLIRI